MQELNTVYLWGIRIDEPVVTVTDLLVSFLCFLYAYKIHQSGKTEKTFLYFKIYFFTMGIATMLGGLIGHAFLYLFDNFRGELFYWKLPGWIMSMISIMFVERAAIEHTRIYLNKSIVNSFKVVNIIEFLIFLTLTVTTLNFFFVEFHSGYGLMFVVLSLESFLFYKTRNIAGKYILTGIGFAAVAALIFMNEISFHQWLNHISASHVLMAIAATFFYLGAIRIDMSEIKQ